jgi:hypothetical protein
MPSAGLARLIAELRAAPSARDAGEALARLRVRRETADVAVIDEGESGDADTLAALRDDSVAVVRFSRGVYARVPPVEGRVRLLEPARRAARDEIVLHVVVSDERSHAGRLAIDVPRRVLRRAGVRTADPGDRFGPERYAHCFFDDEALLDEVARAGLVIAKRRGSELTLHRARAGEAGEAGGAGEAPPDSFAIEVGRVVRAVRDVDARRRSGAPQAVLEMMRSRGRRAHERGPIGRARLQRAIGWVDALVPGGGNCYRRVLLEIALDAGAARETVVFGLDVGSTGHVAFEHREDRTFDVAFAIPAPADSV